MMGSVNKLAIFLFVGFAILGDCICNAQGTCFPEFITVPPFPFFDVNKFVNRQHFVQRIYVRSPELVYEPVYDCHSLQLKVGQLGSVYLQENYTRIDDRRVKGENSSLAVPRYADDASVWQIYDINREDQYKTIITHTDYDTYGVMHWCPYMDTAAHKYERIMTFTWDPNPIQDTIDKLKNLVSSLGFPTENVIKVEHHAGCEYVAECKTNESDK